MTVFTSLAAAITAGFSWYSFSREYNLHIVRIDFARNGRRVGALAFAKINPEEDKKILSVTNC